MITLTDRRHCCGCSACASACPHGAIKMIPDGMGFLYPKIDPVLCTDCGICEKVCAFKAADAKDEPQAEAIRFPALLRESQSGGLA